MPTSIVHPPFFVLEEMLSRREPHRKRASLPHRRWRMGSPGFRDRSTMASRQAVLGMERASFFYGSSRVFENVSFLLDDARTALVGENGAGKSTLLKCLRGELELNSGQIVKSRGLRVGYVPQEIPAGLDGLTVRRVLEDVLERLGSPGEDWKIDILLDEIGVSYETAEGLFGALSGGWQRLV